MSIDKLYCYDSMYNDNITITGEPLTIDLSSIQAVTTNSTMNPITITGANSSNGVYTLNNTGTISSGLTYPLVIFHKDHLVSGVTRK
jgi:hypothetical protein